MIERQAPRFRRQRNIHRIFNGAVPPTQFRWILTSRVLRVVDHQIGVAQELCMCDVAAFGFVGMAFAGMGAVRFVV